MHGTREEAEKEKREVWTKSYPQIKKRITTQKKQVIHQRLWITFWLKKGFVMRKSKKTK